MAKETKKDAKKESKKTAKQSSKKAPLGCTGAAIAEAACEIILHDLPEVK